MMTSIWESTADRNGERFPTVPTNQQGRVPIYRVVHAPFNGETAFRVVHADMKRRDAVSAMREDRLEYDIESDGWWLGYTTTKARSNTEAINEAIDFWRTKGVNVATLDGSQVYDLSAGRFAGIWWDDFGFLPFSDAERERESA